MPVVEELIRAPAKVNLSLRLQGVRADGYHLIDSVMVPIDLCDNVRVTVRAPAGPALDPLITVRSDSTDLPTGSRNLAYRGAEVFLRAAKRNAAVDIEIHKRIPVGGGLGGGSSDAAAVMLGLNRILGRPLRAAQLAELGATIGADIPFFVHGRPARITGVGEQVAPLTLGMSLNLVVCWEGFALATGLVYAHARQPPLSLTSDSPVSNIAAFVEGRRPFTDLLVNDLEEAAAEIHPEVLSLKARIMAEGAQAALMTGSGSAVFGLWPDSAAAINAATRLQRQGLWAEAVRTLELSPALGS